MALPHSRAAEMLNARSPPRNLGHLGLVPIAYFIVRPRLTWKSIEVRRLSGHYDPLNAP